MSIVPLFFLLPLFVVLAIPLVPLAIPLLVVALAVLVSRVRLMDSYGAYAAALQADAYLKDRRIAYVLFKLALIAKFDGAMFMIREYVRRARLAARIAAREDELIGVRHRLQEIHEIVHRVERGEWWPELGDPMDHIKYEVKEGMLSTGSLLYDRD